MSDKQSYTTPTKCPKCGGELSDWWDGEPISAFVGEWSDDRFRCEGHLIEAKDDVFMDGKGNRIAWYNRTKSCGYFGLADFGGDEMKDNTIALVAGLAVAAFIAKLAYDERKVCREETESESRTPSVLRVPDDYKGR